VTDDEYQHQSLTVRLYQAAIRALGRAPGIYLLAQTPFRLIRNLSRVMSFPIETFVDLRYLRRSIGPSEGGSAGDPASSPRHCGRDAVVFAAYVPDEAALTIAHEFLDVFKKDFSDADLYVGVNPGSLPEWSESLANCGLRVYCADVDPDLVIDSDASAFQKALELMAKRGHEYDIVWFGHTKGVTHREPAVRRDLINTLFKQRAGITRLFENPRVGSFGYGATLHSWLITAAHEVLEPLVTVPYDGIGLRYCHTFYAMRGSIVKGFLETCSADFFQKNLVRDLGYNRFFFEGVFSTLADKYGYYPLYRRRIPVPGGDLPVTRASMSKVYADWEMQLPEEQRISVFLR
jgi:hypothetical protein